MRPLIPRLHLALAALVVLGLSLLAADAAAYNPMNVRGTGSFVFGETENITDLTGDLAGTLYGTNGTVVKVGEDGTLFIVVDHYWVITGKGTFYTRGEGVASPTPTPGVYRFSERQLGGLRGVQLLVCVAREADAGLGVVVVAHVAACLDDRPVLLGIEVSRAQQAFEAALAQRPGCSDLRFEVRDRKHDCAQPLDVEQVPKPRILGVSVRDAPAGANVGLDLGGIAVDADDVLVLQPQIVVGA